MSYTAQELNTKIALQRRVQGVDEIGQPIDTWETYGEAFAKVEPLVGREYMLAQQVPTSQAKAKVTMRWRDGVLPSDRIVARGQTWEIVDVQNARFRNFELLLYVTTIG